VRPDHDRADRCFPRTVDEVEEATMSTFTDLDPAHRQDQLEAKKIEVTYVTALLEERRKQRERLDVRTNILITCSGALITVVGVLAALLPRDGASLRPPPGLVLTFTSAMALLLLAVLLAQGVAIFTGRHVWTGSSVRTTGLQQLLNPEHDPVTKLGQRLRMDCEDIAALDAQCRTRHRGLMVAGVLQLAGVIALGVSLLVFLGPS
jgi:hypothetical protein